MFKECGKGIGLKVKWSESLPKGTDKVELAGIIYAIPKDSVWKISLSNCLFDWVSMPDETSASALAIALATRSGTGNGV